MTRGLCNWISIDVRSLVTSSTNTPRPNQSLVILRTQKSPFDLIACIFIKVMESEGFFKLMVDSFLCIDGLSDTP